MNIFDIMGPVMVGPSSSHTAGAVRIGRVARMILGEDPVEAHIFLHGSFAKTFKGHGTDRALAAGIMAFQVDDVRIKDSLVLARQNGIKLNFQTVDLGQVHPNTVCIELRGKSDKWVSVIGASTGGGNIVISKIDDIEVEFSGQSYTLVISHTDAPGVIAAVTCVLASENINIAFMKVFRKLRGGGAIMIIETDQSITDERLALIKQISRVLNVTVIMPVAGE